MVRLAAFGAIVVLAACGGGSQPATGSAETELVSSLCRARDLALDGEVAAADAEFMDHAHQALHELAARLDRRDRASAARLLEAKQRVESALAARRSTLPDDLDRLVAATADAVVAAAEPRPEACEP